VSRAVRERESGRERERERESRRRTSGRRLDALMHSMLCVLYCRCRCR
jgi:hypothetical protein